MHIPKPSEEDKLYLRSLVPDDERVEVKAMFGNLGAFVNGTMFAGTFGPVVGVRLDPAGCAELLAIDGAGPFGPAEHPMNGYVSLPPDWREDPQLAAVWIERALDHVVGLPPKKAKTPRRSPLPHDP